MKVKTPIAKTAWNKNKIVRFLAMFILLLFITNEISAQVWTYSVLNRGKVWTNISNSLRRGGEGVDPGGVWPMVDYPGYTRISTSLVGPLNYINAAGFSIYGEVDGVAQAYSINSVFYASSAYVEPVEDEQLIQNYNIENPSLNAEEMTTGSHKVKDLNAIITHRSMVWSYPEYDDFIIHEITITNDGTVDLTDLHFGMHYGIMMTQRSDDWNRDEKYDWDTQRNLFYFWDDWRFLFDSEEPIAFNFGVGPQRGDIFDARDIWEQGSREHELDAPAFFTAIVLDSNGGNVYQNILEYMGQGTGSAADLVDKMFLHGADQPTRLKDVMTHQQPRISWDDAKAAGAEGGNKFERQPQYLISCGPYDLTPSESVTLVFAEVLGEMDRAKIVEGGIANIDLNKTEGRDALLQNVDNCRELFNNNYQISDHPPMTVTNGENSLELTPIGGGIRIEFPPVPNSYTDPATGVNDFAGYKIYRSNYFTIGPWNLVATIPNEQAQIVNGNVRYEDKGLSFGVGVYYAVTSYDNNGNESGKVNNNRFPVYPQTAPNDDFSKKVYVAPNPFRQHSRLFGAGEQYRLEFINIPSKCKIKIYTMVGELVREINHDDGSGSEAWGSIAALDYMLNEWMLAVAPGIYVYLIENEVQGHAGETKIGKFAIIK